MIKTQIGTNASKIWQFRNRNFKEIITELSITNAARGMDLGLLPRENKIFFYPDNNNDRIMLLYN
jgi:hypothetical protein